MERIARKVRMDLAGEGGNAYVLLAHFRSNAKRQGWSSDEIEAVLEEAKSDDYVHLLRTLMDHTEEPNEDIDEETIID